jgi:DNA-binding transcriptional LysR family regulator
MADRLTALRVFQRVAHQGNLSRAARDLGLSQPSVSRIIAELESELGASLFARTTRALTLTERGAEYLRRIEPVLEALEEADHAARGAGELRGRLRVAISSSLGVREIIPRLPEFLSAHPALRVDLTIADGLHDLLADGVDVALRASPMPDSTAVARKLAEAPRVLAASPAYIARAGAPMSPYELASHCFVLGPGAGARVFKFAKDGRAIAPAINGRVSVTTNEAATAAAVAGLGITVSSLWGCRAELDQGTLVRLLTDWVMPPVELHAVFPPGHSASPAARSLVQHLVASL